MTRERGGTQQRTPVLEILANLKLAVAQLRLYPKDSPQVLKVGTSAYQSVAAFLKDGGSMTLTRTPRGLLVNGKRLPASGEATDTLETFTLDLLQDVRVKSISFRKGLSIDELITFLNALVHKFWNLKEGKEINHRLREERVLQVTVDEVEYVAVGAGDLVVTDAARRLQEGRTRVSELLRTLDGLIDAAAGEGLDSELRLQIMKKLLDQDPTLLQRVKEEGVPGSRESDRSGWIPLEQALQALGDIARMMGDAEPPEREVLRRIGLRLADAFRHDPTAAALIRKFLTNEMAELLPSWIREAESDRSSGSATAATRAASILAMEEDEQVHTLAREAPALAKELAALESHDLLAEIVIALTGFLRDRMASRRAVSAEALLSMRAAWESPPLEETRAGLEQRLRSALDSEQDPSAYPKLAELAALMIDTHVRSGRLEAASVLLSILRGHYRTKQTVFPQRVESAYHALERVASDAGFALLLERLRVSDPEAERIVELLDAAAVQFLIGRMRGVESLPDRIRFAEILRRSGPSTAAVFGDEVVRAATPPETLRLLEVLPHAVPDDIAELTLGQLLRHSSPAVRRRAALVLGERAYARSGTLLADVLREEKDPSTRTAFADSLGRLRHAPAVPVLGDIADARDETDETRAAACLALGRIGDPLAVPFLLRAVAKARTLMVFLPSPPPQVRAAAARALAAFSGDPSVRDALRVAQKDPEGAVRIAARESLSAPLLRTFGDPAREAAWIADAEEAAGEGAFAGWLAEIALDRIGPVLEQARKTGLLTVDFSGSRAKIYLDGGAVTAADFEGHQDRKAFEAFASHREGVFLFQPGVPAPQRRLRSPFTALLRDAGGGTDQHRP